jgi:ABC-type nitrate/sulfonate/bicarbonate transport system ATPase subunit
LARALAVKPEVLLLDEPFSALDPKTTHELHEDLLKIWRETKVTVVMVSHLIEEAVSLADRVVLMKDGRIEDIFPITLPYPRREQGLPFHTEVLKIRKSFFA